VSEPSPPAAASVAPVVHSANIAPSVREAPKKVAAPPNAGATRPVASAPATKPAAPKPNCDPNFYLDAQGEHHFKPECFP